MHRELTKSHTAELTLDSIVRFTLEPYSERFNITGDKVRLGAKQAQNVAFAIHELATNAVKYGALSNTEGNVEVSWKVADASGEAILHLKWYERDGSPVLSPERVGFGTSLLKASFGDIKLEFASEGLRCEIREVLN